MSLNQLTHYLKLAFFPIIACVLLTGHASGQTPVRTMPLGDSITGSPGCWRAMLVTYRPAAQPVVVEIANTL